MSHTPGPWFGRHGHRTTVIRGIYTKDGHCVVTFGGIAKPASKEGQDNANLIAAAPDLLSALERLEYSYALMLAGKPVRDVSETLAEAHAAVKKARGQ